MFYNLISAGERQGGEHDQVGSSAASSSYPSPLSLGVSDAPARGDRVGGGIRIGAVGLSFGELFASVDLPPGSGAAATAAGAAAAEDAAGAAAGWMRPPRLLT